MKTAKDLGSFGTAAFALAMLGILVSPSSAWAESNRSTYVSRVDSGFESSRWADQNYDNHGTKVGFYGCVYRSGNVSAPSVTYTRIEVRKDLSLQPDESRGSKNLYCRGSAIGDWGRQSAGNYFFKINNNGGYYDVNVSANPVKMWW